MASLANPASGGVFDRRLMPVSGFIASLIVQQIPTIKAEIRRYYSTLELAVFAKTYARIKDPD